MGSECSSHQQAIKQSSNLSHPAFTSDPPCALSKWSLKCAHKQSRSLLKSQIYPLWIMKQKAKTNAHQWPINIFGWWFQPLWKILVSWDDYSQYMEEMFQTTNQIYIYFSNVPPHPSCLEPLLVTSSTFSHLGTAAGQVGGSGLPFITLRSENVGKHGKARLLYAFITFIGFQLSYQSIQIINLA